MNCAIFLVLLAVCSAITSVVTEAEKKLLEDFPKNLLAMISGVIIGVACAALYYFFEDKVYTETSIVYMVLLAISSGFGAMLGYDKVIQTVEQIKEKLTK